MKPLFLLSAIVSLIVFRDFSATAAPVDDLNIPRQVWRCPANGGINVLYCYLRINGFPCEYSDLIGARDREVGKGPYSAKTLVNIAAAQHLPLRAASLSMMEMDACPKPVIAYMTSETPDDGEFVLILSVTKMGVYYVSGPSAGIEMLSLENFRRGWSGIALLPTATHKRDMLGFAFGFGISLAVGFRLWKARANKIQKET